MRRQGQRIGTWIGVSGSIGSLGVVVLGCCLWSSVARADGFVPGVGVGVGVAAAPGLTDVGTDVVRDPAPDPGLGPDQVVGIVLHALQHNDDPKVDHGIAITFAFTSPENHDVTGPIDRFRALVKSPAYRPIIGHARAERGPIVVDADHARERVAITGARGERAVYVFLLSRQEVGAHKGCWMADGMLREADPLLESRDRSLLTPVLLRKVTSD